MFLLGTHRTVLQRARLTLDRDLGAGNFFWYACRAAADLDRPILHTAVRDGSDIRPHGHSLTELRSRVVGYADWYTAQGVRKSSRVGVYTTDGLAGLLHHVALTSIGAVTVLANPKMPADVAVGYFRRTDPVAVIADEALLRACVDAGMAAPSVSTVAEVDAAAPPTTSPLPGSPHRHTPGDLVLISHSSGTTGVPKPAVFTHGGFFIGKRERLWNFPSRRDDRLLTALPHSHSAGISYLSLALLLGLPTLMSDDVSGRGVADAINAFHPTIVIGFPLSLAELPVDALSEPAGRAVHTWMGMGDASHERHIRPLVNAGGSRTGGRWVPGSTYVDGLGSSEMGMVLFKQAHTPHSSRYGRLIGRPVGVVREAVVLDERGDPVPVGSAGLLGVRTPSVTPGYWNDPDRTDEARRGRYFLTGDVVRRDEAGNFFHLDRTPDVIVTASGPVYSLPAEEVVLNTTGALDAAVFAVADPDEPAASLPVAVVLFADRDARTADELLAACNARLGAEGLPGLRGLTVAAERAELPVGVTGKVLKRVLRDRHRDLLRDGGARPGDSVAVLPAVAVPDNK